MQGSKNRADGTAALKMLNREQVAEILGCSIWSIARLVKAGELPAPVKVGGMNRWFQSDIEAWQQAKAEQRGGVGR